MNNIEELADSLSLSDPVAHEKYWYALSPFPTSLSPSPLPSNLVSFPTSLLTHHSIPLLSSDNIQVTAPDVVGRLVDTELCIFKRMCSRGGDEREEEEYFSCFLSLPCFTLSYSLYFRYQIIISDNGTLCKGGRMLAEEEEEHTRSNSMASSLLQVLSPATFSSDPSSLLLSPPFSPPFSPPLSLNLTFHLLDYYVDNVLTYNADYRAWGGGYWFQNTRFPYWAMLANVCEEGRRG